MIPPIVLLKNKIFFIRRIHRDYFFPTIGSLSFVKTSLISKREDSFFSTIRAKSWRWNCKICSSKRRAHLLIELDIFFQDGKILFAESTYFYFYYFFHKEKIIELSFHNILHTKLAFLFQVGKLRV